jgi:hypothetical protein
MTSKGLMSASFSESLQAGIIVQCRKILERRDMQIWGFACYFFFWLACRYVGCWSYVLIWELFKLYFMFGLQEDDNRDHSVCVPSVTCQFSDRENSRGGGSGCYSAGTSQTMRTGNSCGGNSFHAVHVVCYFSHSWFDRMKGGYSCRRFCAIQFSKWQL